MNITLVGKRIFTVVLKYLEIKDHSGLFKWVINSMASILVRVMREKFAIDSREGGSVETGRESDAATSQGILGTTRNWKRQGTECPLEPSGKYDPAEILILDFQVAELW